MKKIGIVAAAAIVIVVLAVALAGCAEGSALGTVPSGFKINLNSQQEGIWVNGTGKVSAVPDVAILRLGIEAQSPKVADAQAQAAEAMDKVMKALTANGVAEKDIQTQTFNISKVTRWDDKEQKEVLIGYRVTNIVQAKIRTMSKVGATIDAVATAGGDLTRINGIGFSVEDPTIYNEVARQKAMADAEAKAKQIAQLSGITLGKPTYITESSYIPQPIFRGSFEAMAPAPAPAPTPISAGELDITVNVQVVYSILELTTE
jgi:uncharacterized protein YggE